MSSALRGDVRDAHITGDQSAILPTDAQKNTVSAFAKEKGVNSIEEFGLTLGDHFITPTRKGHRSAYRNRRILLGSDRDRRRPHEHPFVRAGTETRTTVVTVEGRGADRPARVVTGPKDLVVAKATGSEFWGFRRDTHTTGQQTADRIMATSLVARWRYKNPDVDIDIDIDIDIDKSYAQVRALHSRILLSDARQPRDDPVATREVKAPTVDRKDLP